ncbi:hypothetical protein R9X50_00024300 [Acrodontium crateriforme]|uniref:HIG1 domain-containing protein n=1 Tax=Acrodontium crateriforme TaxID=150365 RepID=A0AAQ3LXF4_9PEZI|nr:hypothetical protein R9X50_00024300 [Acrodontium crateriforme]
MSVPGNINPAPPPSSFDEDVDFYQESRWAKLKRKIIEEPLIPLGCALTCWALLEATKSIRTGDKHRTNRMFRRRIYAQGFTIFAMLIGSAYWKDDRDKRSEYNELLEDKKKKDKHDAWLKELEIREEEEQALRGIRKKIMSGGALPKQNMSESEKRVMDEQARKDAGQPKGGFSSVKSVLEDSEIRRDGPIMSAARALWQAS